MGRNTEHILVGQAFSTSMKMAKETNITEATFGKWEIYNQKNNPRR
ncbi:MAG: hypothetical protein R3B55_01905 [Candidatus Paceibacterota bacterium]